jgi:membrane-associated phospholipid phosphatase
MIVQDVSSAGRLKLIMKPTTFLVHCISALVMVTGCNFYVDACLANFVKQLHLSTTLLAKNSSDIPDILLPLVCVITITSAACYQFRAKKEIFTRTTFFFQLLAYAVPISYILKVCLKYIFGRITTRAWLVHPELYGFNWFHGSAMYEGFPSGHMLVFTTLIAATWRFYPRYRYSCVIFLLLLAVALIITNYHFLGDVVAGLYLGLFVEAGTYQVLQRQRGLYGS